MVMVTKRGGVTVVELGPEYGALDEAVMNKIRDTLLELAVAADPPRLVLDLSHTSYIGSYFVEVVVRVWKRVKERGGRMVFCGLQPFCAEVLRVLRLDKIWRIFATQDEAIAAAAE